VGASPTDSRTGVEPRIDLDYFENLDGRSR